MSLKVELKPGEKLLIGNCVVTNGDQRAWLFIDGKAPILREKDILRAETANTPARRIYLAVQLMYIREDGRIPRTATAKPLDARPIPSGEPIAAVLEIAGGRAVTRARSPTRRGWSRYVLRSEPHQGSFGCCYPSLLPGRLPIHSWMVRDSIGLGSGGVPARTSDADCRIEVREQGESLRLGDVAPACAYYCGPGASFAGKAFAENDSASLAVDFAGDPLC